MQKLIPLVLILLCGLTAVVAQTPKMARVITTNAVTRDLPSPAGSIGQKIPTGTLMSVLDEKHPWYVVRIGDIVGWMDGNAFEYITQQPEQPLEALRQLVIPEPAAPPKVSSPRQDPPPVRTSQPSRSYTRGSRGGCYYISGSGRKVYVDRSLCN